MSRLTACLTLMVVFLQLVGLGTTPVLAQSTPTGWTAPQKLSETDDWGGYNALVGAPDGTVHAFWHSDPTIQAENQLGEIGADNLWYAVIRDGQVGPRVNILTSQPDGRTQKGIRAAIDPLGYLHVFAWPKPQCLRHNSAHVSLAQRPQEWLAHSECVGETAWRFGLTQDQAGNLHLAYANIQAQVIYYLWYSPTLDSWSPPEVVHTVPEGTAAYDVRLAVDPSGRIHVVWMQAEAPTYYPPTGIYYAQSSDGGLSWSTPQEIAGRGHAEPEIIALDAERIHIVWNGSAAIQNRYHRYSTDGGQTWSSTHVFEISGGLLGPPALAVDSSGTLHAVFSGEVGLYYAFWRDGEGWSPLQRLWSTAEHAGDPAAVVTEGNRLHVTFRNGVRQIWYISRQLEAPHIPPVPVPEPNVVAEDKAQSPTPTEPPAAPITRATPEHPVLPSEPQPARELNALLVGVLPAVLLVAAVFGLRARKR